MVRLSACDEVKDRPWCDCAYRVQGSGLRVWVESVGSGVWGRGEGSPVVRLRVWGSWIRDQGFGLGFGV